MIKAALNGKRSKQENRHVPITALELIAEAKAALAAGAQAIHFHVRDQEGNETFDPNYLNLQVGQMKDALPKVPIGISTGAWVEPNIIKRVELISAWERLPDFVSINGHEKGFEQIVEAATKKGIAIEAGIQNAEAARLYIISGMLKHCFRILIEPQEQDIALAIQNITGIEKILEGEIQGQSVLLHGFEQTTWPVLKQAMVKGYDTRIGFEDTLYDSTGRLAVSNADLVEHALRLR